MQNYSVLAQGRDFERLSLFKVRIIRAFIVIKSTIYMLQDGKLLEMCVLSRV